MPSHLGRLSRQAGASPKLKTSIANLITDQIYGNLHQPGLRAAVLPEAITRLIGAQKTILGHALGSVQVAQGSQREAEYLGPIQPYQRFKVLGDGEARTDGSFQFGRRRQFHGVSGS